MPYRRYQIPAIFIILLTGLATCRESYTPPAITTPNRYLVVDGFINAGANSVTSFRLNRTRNLGDSTVIGIPELNAQVAVMSSNGTSYPLTDTAGVGTYTSLPLNLDASQQYQLFITTSDRQKYASNPVPCEPTPPIDSVFWRQPFDLNIYVSTHDATGRTHYYRYDYNETWEHDAELQTVWGVANGMIYVVDSTTEKYRCWTTDTSTNILLANSVAQTQDVIDGFTLLTIPNGDPRAEHAYSILVRQYALTEDAYNYWQLIQKTTQNVGTFFDLQPTQLTGNIHCSSNPAQPVIGYLSACNPQQQRIVFRESALSGWVPNPAAAIGCDSITTPVNPNNPFIYNYPDTDYAPWYFISMGPLVLAKRICLDCTQLGGTRIRPSFMPE